MARSSSRGRPARGLKHLAITRGVGDQGFVASTCPKQLTDTTQADDGYNPAASAIIDRLKVALGAPWPSRGA